MIVNKDCGNFPSSGILKKYKEGTTSQLSMTGQSVSETNKLRN